MTDASFHVARIAELEEMLQDDPEDAMLHFLLGSEHQKTGQPELALDCFARATELDPAYSAAWSGLAAALEASGDTERALGAWREAYEVATRQGDNQVARVARAALVRNGMAPE